MMHAHVVSSVTYSARVNGVNEETLEDLRTIVRTATSTQAAGGSKSVDLMLQKNRYADPAHAAITLPLIEWATRINEAERNGSKTTVDKHRKAWTAARDRIVKINEGKEVRIWKHVNGPAAACIASLYRIGWGATTDDGWHKWIDRRGNVFDLRYTTPVFHQLGSA